MNFKFKTEPYQHQLDVFNRFKDKDYFALFCDMGIGKTKMALDIAAYKYSIGEINAVLILAPNNVHTQWIKEQVPIHLAVPYAPFLWQSGQRGRKIYDKRLQDFLLTVMPKCLKIMSMNIEALQGSAPLPTIAEYVKNHKCFVIVDEATRIKHNTAKRSKTVHRLNKYGQRCILTGTPTAKSPFDLWSMFEFLKANYFDCSYFIFQHRYGVMMQGVNPFNGGRYTTLIDEKQFNIVKSKIKKVKDQRGGTLMPSDYEMIAALSSVSEKNVRFIETQEKYVKYKRLDELRDYIANDTYSIKKEDCLDLPEKIYETLEVDMSKDQRMIYNNLKEQLLAEYEDEELSVLNKVSLTMRLMQVCGGFFPFINEKDKTENKPIGKTNPKIELLKLELDELGDKPIIIWAQFVAELKALYEALKKDYSCGLYYGATGPLARKDIIDKFRTGDIQIFIGNPATAGFGLNLQHCTNQYYFSNSFKTEDRLQAEDRSHRIGVKSACVYKDIVMKNSIDEKVHQNIVTGRNLNDYFKSLSLREIFNDTEEE